MGNAYRPSGPAVKFFTTPVSSEVSVRSALGMTAPVGSVTVPLREPFTLCARAAERAKKQSSSIDAATTLDRTFPPMLMALAPDTMQACRNKSKT